MEERIFEVGQLETKTRLDLFLTFHNNDLTRSFIKNSIIKGNIYVNGNHGASSAYKVKPGDKIKLIVENEVTTKVSPEKIDLDIIFEDDNYLVINKPYGMVVHPANGNWSGTLVNALVYKNSQISEVGSGIRPGIVHRLDKDTSGVILVAKNNESLWWLTRQFAERKVQKTYECFVFGKFEIDQVKNYNIEDLSMEVKGDHLVVESGLERSKFNRKLVTVDPDGKNSITYIKPIKYKEIRKNIFTLCEVEPHTGRTHQIRAHMKALGFPIWGDPLYMSHKQLRIVNDISQELQLSNRLFLHAKKITFKDKSGKERSFEAELPKDLKKISN